VYSKSKYPVYNLPFTFNQAGDSFNERFLWKCSPAKENEQTALDIHYVGAIRKSVLDEHSFLCLDTKERTNVSAEGAVPHSSIKLLSGRKIRAGEKTAENFLAELGQIIYGAFSKSRGDEYLFCRPFIIVLLNDAASRRGGLNTPFRNFLNAIFSQAILSLCRPTPYAGMKRACDRSAGRSLTVALEPCEVFPAMARKPSEGHSHIIHTFCLRKQPVR